MLLTLVIPVDLSGSAEDLGEVETLEVVALGEKNPDSLGSEVWLFDIIDDGEPIDHEKVVLGETWAVDDGAIRTTGEVGDSALWLGRAAKGLEVVLLAHQYSGIVEISWGDTVEVIDLYDPEGTQVTIELPPSSPLILYRTSVLLAHGLAIGLTLLALTVWLVQRPSRSTASDGDVTPSGRWHWGALATPPALVWSIHLLAFWPGLMSVDSTMQWGQVLVGHFNDWHPAFHTMLEWLVTRLAMTPAVVAGAQILALSGVVGWALATMRRLGFPPVGLWVISVLVAFWPSSGITVITLWKDVAYGIGVLALGVIVLREVDGRLSILGKRYGWVVVGGLLALTALVHHAGIYVAIGSLVALGIATRKRAVVGAAAMAIALMAFVQFGIYNVAGVVGDHPGTDGVVVHHLGAHLVDETPLTQEDRAQLDDLLPTGDTDWYNCETLTPVVLDPRFDMDEIHENGQQARSVWLRLLTRNPSADLEHMVCNSSLVWRIRMLPGAYVYNNNLFLDDLGDYSTITDNEHGLELEPVIPVLTEPLADTIRQTELPETGWLWWRGPVYLYLIVFGAIVASLRSANWRYWVVAVPSFLVAAVLAIAAPAQDFRYMYPVVLSGLVLAPYLLFGVRRAPLTTNDMPNALRHTPAVPGDR
jgi:hypothetical protein